MPIKKVNVYLVCWCQFWNHHCYQITIMLSDWYIPLIIQSIAAMWHIHYAMVIYGHRMASISQTIVGFYRARTVPVRRQEELCNKFFRHRTVKFLYYFKFHGARTAFCRVFQGKMTSVGVRLHTSGGHRTMLVYNLNRTISTATVRAPYGARSIIVVTTIAVKLQELTQLS